MVRIAAYPLVVMIVVVVVFTGIAKPDRKNRQSEPHIQEMQLPRIFSYNPLYQRKDGSFLGRRRAPQPPQLLPPGPYVPLSLCQYCTEALANSPQNTLKQSHSMPPLSHPRTSSQLAFSPSEPNLHCTNTRMSWPTSLARRKWN
jgi:hypothetical protein